MSSPANSVTAPAPIDITVVMELLGSMKTTHGMLNQSLNSLVDQGNSVKALGPTIQEGHDQIKKLQVDIENHDAQRADIVANVKDTIRGKLREEALEEMQKRIKEQISAEVKRQVEAEVKEQLVRDHLGTPLNVQVDAGREQITALQAAVQNSKARRENSAITWSDMTTNFKDVVRPDGTRSAKWPANVNSLDGLSAADLADLLRDYDLHVHASHAMNLNSFLRHIGVDKVTLH
ncbi:uncharacterized protein TRAVEDRAFT_56301 [Trametes versicolor FP-101664 SS1]|uniref:uncharacterized protein n=1 Tax=Trametes versicolor (strain FP-101664) TaxID=717944 RepID=UPI00046212F2|nr:uncharacterized protein TRAVEDRAFT_56301 [Trametes versicolor FP-101664 SS1]EIW63193.1 hypothetical protein TRAVEDRAFT_56301 [Trametes versicolor FP-101664 SS1]